MLCPSQVIASEGKQCPSTLKVDVNVDHGKKVFPISLLYSYYFSLSINTYLWRDIMQMYHSSSKSSPKLSICWVSILAWIIFAMMVAEWFLTLAFFTLISQQHSAASQSSPFLSIYWLSVWHHESLFLHVLWLTVALNYLATQTVPYLTGKSPFKLAPVLCDLSHHFPFQHNGIFQAYLVLTLPQPWNQPFLWGSLVPFRKSRSGHIVLIAHCSSRMCSLLQQNILQKSTGWF